MSVLASKHTTGTANAATSVSFDAISASQSMIEELTVIVSYSTAPTNGKVTIKDAGGTNYAEHYITVAGPAPFAFRITRSTLSTQALLVELGAGGGGVIGNVSAHRRVFL